MKQKKLVIIFFIVTTILLSIVPMINIFFLYSNHDLNAKKINKKFLFSINNAEGAINYYLYRNHNTLLNQNRVIVGKDKYLFLGNHYNNVIDKTQGLYSYTSKEIETWTDKLKTLQTWYENHNIHFILVLVPNKHTVYNKKLPDDIIYKKGETITDDIIKLAHQKHIKLLDTRDILSDKKEVDQMYLYTDSHWNKKGASLIFNETMEYINNYYHTNYDTPKYSLSRTYSGGSDLARLSKMNSILPGNYEKTYTYEFEKPYDICHGNINQKHQIKQCDFGKNKAMILNHQDQYTLNSQAVNDTKLLLLGDSFAIANSQLYSASFSTVWAFHYNHISGKQLANFTNEHKPDIVIYQVNERVLYNQNIVRTMSN